MMRPPLTTINVTAGVHSVRKVHMLVMPPRAAATVRKAGDKLVADAEETYVATWVILAGANPRPLAQEGRQVSAFRDLKG
jgi:hypothetical protein